MEKESIMNTTGSSTDRDSRRVGLEIDMSGKITAEMYEERLKQLTKEISDKDFELMVLKEGQAQLENGVSNYDELIEKVVERERKGNEKKHAKVLRILKEKDDFIAQYQKDLSVCMEAKISVEEELLVQKEYNEKMNLRFEEMINNHEREKTYWIETEQNLKRELRSMDEFKTEVWIKQDSEAVELDQLKVQNKEYASEVNRLMLLLQDCERGMKECESENERCQNMIKELREINDSKERERETTNNLLHASQREALELQELLSESEKCQSELRNSCEKMEREISETSESTKAILKEKENYLNTIESLRHDIEECSRVEEQRLKLISEQQKQLDYLDSLQMESKLEALKRQPESEMEMEHYVVTIENNMKTIASLKKQICALEANVKSVENEKVVIFRQRNELEEKCKEEELSHQLSKTSLEEKIADREGCIDELREIVRTLERRIETIKQLPNLDEFLLMLYNGETKTGEEFPSPVDTEMARLKTKSNLLEDEVASYKAELLDLEHKCAERHSSTLEGLHSEIGELTSAKFELASENASLKSTCLRLEVQLNDCASEKKKTNESQQLCIKKVTAPNLPEILVENSSLKIRVDELQMQNGLLLQSLKEEQKQACQLENDQMHASPVCSECPHSALLMTTLSNESELKRQLLELQHRMSGLYTDAKDNELRNKTPLATSETEESLLHSEQLRKSAEHRMSAKDSQIKALTRLIENFKREKEQILHSKKVIAEELGRLTRDTNEERKTAFKSLQAENCELRKKVNYLNSLLEKPDSARSKMLIPINELKSAIENNFGLGEPVNDVSYREMLKRVSDLLTCFFQGALKSVTDLKTANEDVASLNSKMDFIGRMLIKEQSVRRMLEQEASFGKLENEKLKLAMQEIGQSEQNTVNAEMQSLKNELEMLRNVLRQKEIIISDLNADLTAVKSSKFGDLLKDCANFIELSKDSISKVTVEYDTLKDFSFILEKESKLEKLKEHVATSLDKVILNGVPKEDVLNRILSADLYRCLCEELSRSRTNLLQMYSSLSHYILCVDNSLTSVVKYFSQEPHSQVLFLFDYFPSLVIFSKIQIFYVFVSFFSVQLNLCFKNLTLFKINSVKVEGHVKGPKLHALFLKQELLHLLRVWIRPSALGKMRKI